MLLKTVLLLVLLVFVVSEEEPSTSVEESTEPQINYFTNTFQTFSSISADQLQGFSEIDVENLNAQQKKVDEFIKKQFELNGETLEKAEEKTDSEGHPLSRFTYSSKDEESKMNLQVVVRQTNDNLETVSFTYKFNSGDISEDQKKSLNRAQEKMSQTFTQLQKQMNEFENTFNEFDQNLQKQIDAIFG